jgi:hypothetical protein
MLTLFTRCWRGEASLSEAFWIVFALLNLMIILPATLVFFHYTHDYDSTRRMANTILFPYLIFSAVCVWRCENNASEFFIVLSKSVVLMSVVSFFPLSVN